jgi:glycosyltransferase involved in cell wall biosynthesis
VPSGETALRLNPAAPAALPAHIAMLDEVIKRADDFDVLHFHIDLLHFPMIRAFSDRTVTTLHGRLDQAGLKTLYGAFPEIPLTSISQDQRRPMPRRVNWVGNVYHGLPADLLPFRRKAEGGYLAFLGRIAPEKGPDRAIEIAVRAGLPLKIAAKIDPVDQAYWDDVIAPLVEAHGNIQFIGEINERQKADFLGNARALLFPIDWPEPFGLVMIEAMSCGTPVIAFRSGSVPEVIDHELSGFIVNDIDEAVDAVSRLDEIDRIEVRATFEERFTAESMAQSYLAIYHDLLGLSTEAAPKCRQLDEGFVLRTVA